MRLTATDLRFFHRFGYLHLRALFDPEETVRITAAFERTLAEFGHARGGAGTPRTNVLGPIQHLPELQALLDDPRILGVAGSVLGDDFTYACGDGQLYSGETQWHPDGSWGELFACKLAFYLDPLTRETGALRVVPGSHHPGHPLRSGGGVDFAKLAEDYGLTGRDLPGAEVLETTPGDLVLFNHDVFHASFGGGRRRRMFTMNVIKRAVTEADHERLRQYIGHHSPSGYTCDIGAHHFRPILDSASPERRRHLEQAEAAHAQVFPQHTTPKTHAEQIAAMRQALEPQVATAST